jgi:hypothetical protein
MNFDDLRDQWTDADIVLLEPREVFDQALIGLAECPNGLRAAAYDSAKCIGALIAAHGWSKDEATDWFESNTRSAYFGENTPVFIEVLHAKSEGDRNSRGDAAAGVKLLGPRW